MLRRVLELGFDGLATGHYARVVFGADGEPQLLMGVDAQKDQSYVLYHLDSERLRRIIFPLGELTKPQVRGLAAELELPVAYKPESQEICFIPRGETAQYLRDRLGAQPGAIVRSDGRQIGIHRGAALYTVGQRNGLGILNEPGPWYVSRIDTASNVVEVSRRKDLACTEVQLDEVTFVSGAVSEPAECQARLRYRARPLDAVYAAGRLRLAEPYYGAAPGQAAVLYDGERVLGGGIIRAAA
jgi:tRNA-specific 2-thiouridylase